MHRPFRNTLHALAATLLLLASAGCQQADNVEGIFSSHRWIFTGFCYTPNWDTYMSQRLDISLEGYDRQHLATFQDDGSLFIFLDGCKLSGKWSADGTSRAFAISNLHVTEGNLDGIAPYAQKFLDNLKDAAWYRGDTNFLQLFDADKHYYLLFGPAE